jgi:hypothetical protein
MHRPGDDDSAAVTFWGKRDLRDVLRKALALLDKHYEAPPGICNVCRQPLPPGEEMFKFHGYSGPCPTDGGSAP